MRLPNPDRAVVDDAKVRDYLLSREHPIGRFKAAVFAWAGYRRESWQSLKADLVAVTLPVTTIWLVPRGSEFPRLVTVYPGGRRWRTESSTR